MSTPTQVSHPRRTTLRTAAQALIALVLMAPVLVESAGLDPAKLPWLVAPLALCAGVARVMAVPQVDAFLRRYVPWLAATPADPGEEGSMSLEQVGVLLVGFGFLLVLAVGLLVTYC